VVFAPPFPAVWLLNFLLPETLTFLFTKPFCRVREEQDHHLVSRSSISLYAFFGEAVNFKVGFYIYCIISILEMAGSDTNCYLLPAEPVNSFYDSRVFLKSIW
jgi:hypothetical protein